MSLHYLEIPIHFGKGTYLAKTTAVGKQQKFISLLSHMCVKMFYILNIKIFTCL